MSHLLPCGPYCQNGVCLPHCYFRNSEVPPPHLRQWQPPPYSQPRPGANYPEHSYPPHYPPTYPPSYPPHYPPNYPPHYPPQYPPHYPPNEYPPPHDPSVIPDHWKR